MATAEIKSKELKDFVKIKVRFSEVDSIRVVWHGSYVAYLEDGREAFGRRYGLGYNDMFKAGLTAPIVDVSIQYKSPATVDDILVLETKYVPSRGAKLVFDYSLYKLENKDLSDEEAFSPKEDTHKLILIARTTQLWMTGSELEISTPKFFQDWKDKYGFGVKK